MKSVVVFISILLLIACGQQREIESSVIDFRDVSFSEALKLAKAERKHLFLYFHFDGCGACKELEKSAFVDADIARYVHSEFVCLDVNTEDKTARELIRAYAPRAAPTCLIVNSDGEAVYSIVGFADKRDFLSKLRNWKTANPALVALRERYHAGDRDAELVRSFIMRLREEDLPYGNVLEDYIAQQSAIALESQENFDLLYDLIPDRISPVVRFRGAAYAAFLRGIERHADRYDREQLDGRVLMGLLDALYESIETSNVGMFDSLMTVVEGVRLRERSLLVDRTGHPITVIYPKEYGLRIKLQFYHKAGDTETYRAVLTQYLTEIQDDSEALNELARSFSESATDKDSLHQASMWAQRSIALESGYENNDTYAALLYRLGEYSKALAQAEKALAIAKRTSLTPTSTEQLIVRIKKARR
jgi:thioredoxin-related protein